MKTEQQNPVIYIGITNAESTAKVGDITKDGVVILVGPKLTTPVGISFQDCEKLFGY